MIHGRFKVFFVSIDRHYEDDFEPEEEETPASEVTQNNMSEPVKTKTKTNARAAHSIDDVYDFGPQNMTY